MANGRRFAAADRRERPSLLDFTQPGFSSVPEALFILKENTLSMKIPVTVVPATWERRW
jgi:hypothetical protein